MHDMHRGLETLSVGGAMIYPLLVFGVLALAIIPDKKYSYRRNVTLPVSLQTLAETCGFARTDLRQQTTSFVPGNYFRRFAQMILTEIMDEMERLGTRLNGHIRMDQGKKGSMKLLRSRHS